MIRPQTRKTNSAKARPTNSTSICQQVVPTPRSIRATTGSFDLPTLCPIILENHEATRLPTIAQLFADRASKLVSHTFPIRIALPENLPTAVGIIVKYDSAWTLGLKRQGYRLETIKGSIVISAGTSEGTAHAFETLLQLFRLIRSENWPGIVIEDWPDFERRGFYYDCARGKVPTRETLLNLVDEIAALKYNEFQLYVENAFEFPGHADMYEGTTPLTAEDLLAVDHTCRERFIDFIPSLTSLGHFDKILSRPRYRKLAEAEPADLKAAGMTTWCDDPWTLCTTDENAKQLLREMYAGFVPQFSSPTFNICCDESWDLGKGRSKESIAKRHSPTNEEQEKTAIGREYVEWVKFCESEARKLGRKIQMWGDIIVKHPALIADLPNDATLLEWGYEANHPFKEHAKLFAERLNATSDSRQSADRSFYVAPGTSSWLSFASRTKNALENAQSAATEGVANEARGYLLTDWGDHGHQQFLGLSLLSLGWSATAAWNHAALPTIGSQSFLTALRTIGIQLFRDPTGKLAELAYELGRTYDRFAWQRFNGSVDFFLFREKWEFASYVNRVTTQECQKVLALTIKLRIALSLAKCNRADAAVLRTEFLLTCDEIIHTMKRTLLRKEWLAAAPATRNPEHEELRGRKPVPLKNDFAGRVKSLIPEAAQLAVRYADAWRMRNRESRLVDVLHEFDRIIEEYQRIGTSR